MTTALREEVLRLKALYPRATSALMPAFGAAQAEEGHVTEERCREIAELLEVDAAYAYGVLTFYTLYRTRPAGRYVLQLCRTLSCDIAGSEALLAHLRERLAVEPGGTTPDGLFTLLTCECLASCGTGPAMLVNEELHEKLTPERVDALLADLRTRASI
jgi:NADH-quinone oxidoreductase E subunit